MKKGLYVFGLSGRMGQEVLKIAESSPLFEPLGGFSRTEPMKPSRAPDVIVDFSLPQALDSLCQMVSEQGSSLVSGTTGFNAAQLNQLRDLGKKVPVFWSANMSFGVYIMCKLTETLAKYSDLYKFHIEETHHIHKKDKPSGTALMIEAAARKSTKQLEDTLSHREGEVFGTHSFFAISSREKLEIRHEALDRGLFAQGAVDVASWIVDQKPGFYVMEDYFESLSRRANS